MAVAAAWLYQHKGDTTEVLIVQAPVAAGEVLSEADLGTAEVAGVDGAIPVEEADAVVGLRAVGALVTGQVLTSNALTTGEVPGLGEKLVAVRLDAGRVPSELGAGSVVRVLAAPAEATAAADRTLDVPDVLAPSAAVHAVDATVDGDVVVSLLVQDADADRVASYSAAGRVTLLQESVSDPSPERGG
jgi:hypothetical protein